MTDQEYKKLLEQHLLAHVEWLESGGDQGIQITRNSFAPILELHAVWTQSQQEGQRLDLTLVAPALRRLDQSDLRGAILQGANLAEAKLERANLLHADLQKAILQEAILHGADLESVNLHGANLRYAQLQGAKLQGANLQWINLQGANLQDANLQNAKLEYANLQDANLKEANLQGANLQRAKLERANLQGADLERADLERADLERANLQGADLRKATTLATSFSYSNLVQADFKGCTLADCDFQEADLTEANFVGVTLGENNTFFGAKAGKIKALPEFLEAMARLEVDLTTGLKAEEAEEKRKEIQETQQVAETKDLILHGIEELKTSITHIDHALQANEGLSAILTLTGTFSFGASVAYVIFMAMVLNSAIVNMDIDHAYGLAVPIFMFLLIGSALLRHDAKNRAQYLTLTQEKNKLQKAAGLMQAAYNFTKEKRIRLGEEGAKASEDLVDSTFRTLAKALLSDGKPLDDPDDSASVIGELLKKIPNPKP